MCLWFSCDSSKGGGLKRVWTFVDDLLRLYHHRLRILQLLDKRVVECLGIEGYRLQVG